MLPRWCGGVPDHHALSVRAKTTGVQTTLIPPSCLLHSSTAALLTSGMRQAAVSVASQHGTTATTATAAAAGARGRRQAEDGDGGGCLQVPRPELLCAALGAFRYIRAVVSVASPLVSSLSQYPLLSDDGRARCWSSSAPWCATVTGVSQL